MASEKDFDSTQIKEMTEALGRLEKVLLAVTKAFSQMTADGKDSTDIMKNFNRELDRAARSTSRGSFKGFSFTADSANRAVKTWQAQSDTQSVAKFRRDIQKTPSGKLSNEELLERNARFKALNANRSQAIKTKDSEQTKNAKYFGDKFSQATRNMSDGLEKFQDNLTSGLMDSKFGEFLGDFPNAAGSIVAGAKDLLKFAGDFMNFYKRGAAETARYAGDIQQSQNLNIKQYGDIEESAINSAMDLNSQVGKMLVGAGSIMASNAKLLSEGWSVSTLGNLGTVATMFDRTLGSGVFDSLSDTFLSLERSFGSTGAESLGDKLNSFQGMFGITTSDLVSALKTNQSAMETLAHRKGTPIDKLQSNLLVATAAMESFAQGAGQVASGLQELASTNFADFMSQTAALGGLLARSGNFNVTSFQSDLRAGNTDSAMQQLATSLQSMNLNEYEYGIYVDEISKALGIDASVVRNMLNSQQNIADTFDEATARMVKSVNSMKEEMTKITVDIDEQVKAFSQANPFTLALNKTARDNGLSNFSELSGVMEGFFKDNAGDSAIRAHVIGQSEGISGGVKAIAQTGVLLGDAKKYADMGNDLAPGGIGMIIGAVVGAVIGIVKTVINGDDALAGLGHAFGSIIDVIMEIMDVVWSLFEVVNPIIQTVLAIVFEVVGTVFDIISDILSPVVELIKGYLAPIIFVIKGILDPILSMVKGLLDMVRGIIKSFINPFASIMKAVSTSISGIMPYIDILIKALSVLISAIMVVFSLVAMLYTAIAGFIGSLGATVNALINFRWNTIPDIWKGYGADVGDAWGGVRNAVGVKDASGTYNEGSLMASVGALSSSWQIAFGEKAPIADQVGFEDTTTQVPDVFMPSNPNEDYSYSVANSNTNAIVDAVNNQTQVIKELSGNQEAQAQDLATIKNKFGETNFEKFVEAGVFG